jgi:endonuclease III-like uncharacterized protein
MLYSLKINTFNQNLSQSGFNKPSENLEIRDLQCANEVLLSNVISQNTILKYVLYAMNNLLE